VKVSINRNYPEIEKSLDEKTIELLKLVSTPNISDAMHRKGAMKDIRSICPGTKAVGRAVTVQTYPGIGQNPWKQ